MASTTSPEQAKQELQELVNTLSSATAIKSSKIRAASEICSLCHVGLSVPHQTAALELGCFPLLLKLCGECAGDETSQRHVLKTLGALTLNHPSPEIAKYAQETTKMIVEVMKAAEAAVNGRLSTDCSAVASSVITSSSPLHNNTSNSDSLAIWGTTVFPCFNQALLNPATVPRTVNHIITLFDVIAMHPPSRTLFFSSSTSKRSDTAFASVVRSSFSKPVSPAEAVATSDAQLLLAKLLGSVPSFWLQGTTPTLETLLQQILKDSSNVDSSASTLRVALLPQIVDTSVSLINCSIDGTKLSTCSAFPSLLSSAAAVDVLAGLPECTEHLYNSQAVVAISRSLLSMKARTDIASLRARTTSGNNLTQPTTTVTSATTDNTIVTASRFALLHALWHLLHSPEIQEETLAQTKLIKQLRLWGDVQGEVGALDAPTPRSQENADPTTITASVGLLFQLKIVPLPKPTFATTKSRTASASSSSSTTQTPRSQLKSSTSTEKPLSIYVSSAPNDSSIATAIRSALASAGHSVHFESSIFAPPSSLCYQPQASESAANLPRGANQPVYQAVLEACNCDVLIVCLSPAFQHSAVCRTIVQQTIEAAGNRITVIPLLLGESGTKIEGWIADIVGKLLCLRIASDADVATKIPIVVDRLRSTAAKMVFASAK